MPRQRDFAPATTEPLLATRRPSEPYNTVRLTSLATQDSRYPFDIARRGDVTEMFALLKQHPSIWQLKDESGCTALHAAASSGAMDVGQLLLQAGVAVREADHDGWEALHYACANGHYGFAAWLLQCGASLDARTDEGWQPIHVAAHTGQTQLARYLAAQGADLRARTTTGHEAMHLAVDAGALDFVQWLLRATGGAAATSEDSDGWLPVHNAGESTPDAACALHVLLCLL